MRIPLRRVLTVIAVFLLLFALVRIGTSAYENLPRIP